MSLASISNAGAEAPTLPRRRTGGSSKRYAAVRSVAFGKWIAYLATSELGVLMWMWASADECHAPLETTCDSLFSIDIDSYNRTRYLDWGTHTCDVAPSRRAGMVQMAVVGTMFAEE